MKKVLILFIFSTIAQARTHKVIVGTMTYKPDNLVVKVGDKIIWINRDISVHSVTSTDHTFNSGSIRPKKTWSFIVKDLGEHPYKCVFHSGMKGKLIVK